MATSPPTTAAVRPWIVSPGWDLAYLVLTPLAIVPAVLLGVQRWLSPEQVYLAVISFASLGHHLPGFMRAYGDRELFARYRWRFLLAPPLALALALLFTPPPAIGRALGLPWTHLHGLELILLLWATWHSLMQTYGFMRIYDLRRGDRDRRMARLDHALCVMMFVAGIAFSDTRMFGLALGMWQTGLPLFGPEALAGVRWAVGAAGAATLAAYAAHTLHRWRRGTPPNGVKLLLAAITGWFWWYCGRLSTNLLVGVAMFEIYHAVQYNAIVWTYNRRLMTRAGERFGPLGFLFRDRWAMLGLYLGAIAAYSSIRFFTASPEDRMFGGDLATAHQWLISLFVASSLLHFYYDGFIWKVSQPRTAENLLDQAIAAAGPERYVPALVHAGKWGMLALIAAALAAAERRYDGPEAAARHNAERRALAQLTPDVPEAAMLASQNALAAGDAEAAAQLAERAAAARPTSHHSQAELAWALMQAERYADAAAPLERALALAPDHWPYLCDLGEARLKAGDAPQAEAALRRAAELAPGEHEPLDRLSLLLLGAGRPGEAIDVLERLAALDPASAEWVYRLGLARLQLGDAARAVPPLRQATRLDAQHVAAWMQLGDAMLALGKAPAAVEAYARAVELAPAAPEARVALADALLQSGLTGQAELTLREGLQRQPDSPELCLTLGLLLQHTGRTAEAVELLRRAEAGGMQLESLGR